MNSRELEASARTLPLCASDQRHDIDSLAAAWASHVGKLTPALERLKEVPTDEAATVAAHTHCGAAILVLVAAAVNFGIDLSDAVAAGGRELGT